MIRFIGRPESHRGRNIHIKVIQATALKPTTNLLPSLKILKDIISRKNVTEQFKYLISLLTDKRLNRNLGTCKTNHKEREEHKLAVSEPVT